jgi:hypothetical protein
MLSYILNGFYLILWSVLLIHCLQQRQFYPIIGRGWGTKILWLLTFIFFNPFLSLLYFAFAVLLRPGKVEEDSKPVNMGSIVVISCIVLVLVVFELPLGGSKAEPVVTIKSSEIDNPSSGKKFTSFEPVLGVIKATNKVQTYSSASTGGDAKVSIRNIMLICHNSHRLIDRAAREFQKSLARLPYVEKVTYCSYGTRPESGGLLPDIFINIDMPEVSESNFLNSRELLATIEWQAGSSMFENLPRSFEDDSYPNVQFSIESELNHVGRMTGIESPQARYKLEAKNISGELIQSIKKQFENLLDKYGQMPKLPDTLYGTYRQSPEFSFINNDNIRHHISGSGLLTDNDTIWQFMDERPTEEALKAYYDELSSLGWTVNNRDQEDLTMQKSNERIHIFRQRNRNVKPGLVVSGDINKPTPETPMIAHYQSRWTEERTRDVMDRLLNSNDVDVMTLLIFEKYFRTPRQRERLCSLIEQCPIPTLDGYLVLARFLADNNEQEKGREMLMLARVMQYTEKGNNIKAHEIVNLAKKLGDESLPDAAIGDEIFRKTGFINTENIDGQISVEKKLDEPLLFYNRLDGGELHTITLRVIRSKEPSPMRSYHLLIVEKRKGRSSSVEDDGKMEPNGTWTAKFDLNSLAVVGKSLHLKIESLADERFRFTVTDE